MQRVQNSANYMPEWQTEVSLSLLSDTWRAHQRGRWSQRERERESPARRRGFFPSTDPERTPLQRVLRDTLGDDWRSHFSEFDLRPFAAASIGQVHRAKLSPSSPLARNTDKYPNLTDLAVKVQFPGVRESIASDLGTLRWLLVASAALPRGLYLDNTLRVMGRELEDECDYEREAECGTRMREFVETSRDPGLREAFAVPRVVDELSGKMVLTTELMHGRPLKDVLTLGQDKRDWVRPRAFYVFTSLVDFLHAAFSSLD